MIASRYGIDADVKVGQKVCFQFKAEDAVLVDREEKMKKEKTPYG